MSLGFSKNEVNAKISFMSGLTDVSGSFKNQNFPLLNQI